LDDTGARLTVKDFIFRPVRRRSDTSEVSAFFTSTEAVDSAVRQITEAGLPRDLVEVVVAEPAAARFYPSSSRPLGHETIRYAGAGALIGLILGVIGSLILISLPSFFGPGPAAFVQLLGPNVATVSGAVIGALIGRFVPRPNADRHSRAGERPDEILVVARAPSETQARQVSELLAAGGGRFVRP
jgi:hypothetical protein